mmetsp:Transcript_30861/g.39863  ORF Transcript_30861/g.39863 Transcript_30861/m.39863 type:complete len:102 (+) Transcript_30861:418-723(+)
MILYEVKKADGLTNYKLQMDPPAAEGATAPPALPLRRRRGGCRIIERAPHFFTIIFVILSLLKLEPLARNSVQECLVMIPRIRAHTKEESSFYHFVNSYDT